ncbi:unnamed protein product [Brassica oleracea]
MSRLIYTLWLQPGLPNRYCPTAILYYQDSKNKTISPPPPLLRHCSRPLRTFLHEDYVFSEPLTSLIMSLYSMFLKPDRKLNRKYFGSRFNMVRPGQTWFNNMFLVYMDGL